MLLPVVVRVLMVASGVLLIALPVAACRRPLLPAIACYSLLLPIVTYYSVLPVDARGY